MKLPSLRTSYWLLFIISVAMLGTAYYFQYVQGMIPCPLCMMQRIILALFALVVVIAALHNPKGWGRFVCGWTSIVVALMGIGASGRQVWLQTFPSEHSVTCGASFNYMINYLPLTETIKLMLTGTGDCAQVHWTLLGLSMAHWVLIAFFCFTIGLLIQMVRLKNKSI